MEVDDMHLSISLLETLQVNVWTLPPLPSEILGQHIHARSPVDGLLFVRKREMKAGHGAKEGGVRATAGSDKQAHKRSDGSLSTGLSQEVSLRGLYPQQQLLVRDQT